MSSNDYFTLKHRSSFNTTQLLKNVQSLSKEVQKHRFVGSSTAEMTNVKNNTDLYLNIVDNNGYEEEGDD